MESVVKRHFRSELKAIDWDFAGEPSHQVTEGLSRVHWYPARFPPQIPAVLIGYFSTKSENVLDPFCGSGTTLVEAYRLGRKPLGVDLNPVACLVSRAKLADVSDSDFVALEERLEEYRIGIRRIGPRRLKDIVPNLEENRRWFHAKTLLELAAIYDSLDKLEGDKRTVCLVCFSAILVSCCSQRKHWGYVCDNVRPRRMIYVPAFPLFLEKLHAFMESKARLQIRAKASGGSLTIDANATVVEGDARAVLPNLKDGSVDLVVTSPPYLSVTDYINSQRLTFLWLPRYDREALKKQEIGARYRRHREGRGSSEPYVTEMSTVLRELRRVLKPDRYLCLVLGESKSHPEYIERVQDAAVKSGFTLVLKLDRRIAMARSLFPRVEKEDVIILQNRP